MADPHPTPPDPHLTAYLAERDEPCPACTYNLRGLKSDRCPECNRELVLQLRLAEPRIAAWIATVVGASVLTGFHGLFLLIALMLSLTRRGGGGQGGMVIWMAVCTVLGGIVLRWLVANRRRFGNFSASTRITLAVITWFVAVMSAVLLPVIFR